MHNYWLRRERDLTVTIIDMIETERVKDFRPNTALLETKDKE